MPIQSATIALFHVPYRYLFYMRLGYWGIGMLYDNIDNHQNKIINFVTKHIFYVRHIL